MSISAITSATAPAPRATDGDSPAKEAAETSATKLAESQNGGFLPNAVPAGAPAAAVTPGGVNKLA
jgi:hypothetical protein